MTTVAALPIERTWTAQPRQREFLRAREFFVLYGGSAGSGKSDALLIHQVRICVNHPGAKCLYVRKTFADLSKPGAIIDRSQELLSGTGAVWKGDTHSWTFPNGARLAFGHLQYQGDLYGYQGAQLDSLCWDELTQFTEHEFDYLAMRVRSTVAGLAPTIRAGTNPDGVGLAWVRRRIVKAAPAGAAFPWVNDDGVATGTARFIPARVTDNQELLNRDPGYLDRLNALPEPLRRAYRDGDWDVFVGQFFGEWREAVHVVAPFPIPREWPKWLGVDYGFGAPFACVWLARAPTGRVYVYRELVQKNVIDREQARRILAASQGERILAGFADPSMWSRQPNGTSIAEVYHGEGLPIAPANNDRRTGWSRVREALAVDDRTGPGLQVFSTCANLIRTLPEMVYDQIDPEDLDTRGEDHVLDATRYALQGAAVPTASEPARVQFGERRNGASAHSTRHVAFGGN